MLLAARSAAATARATGAVKLKFGAHISPASGAMSGIGGMGGIGGMFSGSMIIGSIAIGAMIIGSSGIIGSIGSIGSRAIGGMGGISGIAKSKSRDGIVMLRSLSRPFRSLRARSSGISKSISGIGARCRSMFNRSSRLRSGRSIGSQCNAGGVTGRALGAGAAGIAGCAMTGGAGDGVGAGVVGICASLVRAQTASAAAMKVALIIIPSL